MGGTILFHLATHFIPITAAYGGGLVPLQGEFNRIINRRLPVAGPHSLFDVRRSTTPYHRFNGFIINHSLLIRKIFFIFLFTIHDEFDNIIKRHGDCGEAVNTAGCGPVMRGFESHQSPH